MFTWLSLGKQLWSYQRDPKGQTPQKRRAPCRRPLLEELEQRLVPSGTNYYVNLNGPHGPNGTCALPFGSVQDVKNYERDTTHLPFQPGDIISFAGGQTFSGTTLELTLSDGTPSQPITITSYNGSSCTGGPLPRATIDAPDNGFGIEIDNHGGFRITNLNITGHSDSNNHITDGIRFTNNQGTVNNPKTFQHIYVDNVDVGERPCVPPSCQVPPVAFGGYGIHIAAATDYSYYDDVNITFATLHYNTTGGLFVENRNGFAQTITHVYIGHVQAYNNPGWRGPDTGIGTGTGITLFSAAGASGCASTSCAIIERSLAHDNGSMGINGSGIYVAGSDHVTVQFNETYYNHDIYNPLTGGGCDGHGINFDNTTTNSVMEYNYAHNNDGYGFVLIAPTGKVNNGNTIRYNVSENDVRGRRQAGLPYASIGTSGAVTNGEIYNNTIFQSPLGSGPTALFPPALGVDAAFSPNGHDLHFRNNIVYTASSVDGTPPLVYVASPSGSVTTLLFQGNDYYTTGTFKICYNGTTYGSLLAWQNSQYHQERGSDGRALGTDVNPQLVNAGGGGTIGNADNLSSLAAYKLQSGSPMGTAGLDLTTAEFGSLNVGTRDFYGNMIPGASGHYSIGAFQP